MRLIKHSMAAAAIVSSALLLAACSGNSTSPSPAAGAADAAKPAVAEPEAAAPAAAATATAQAPSAAATYDGKIVHQPDNNRGKDDGWFLVKDGKRRWITEASWLEPNGYKPTDVIYITSEEFNSIPEDPRPIPETAPAAQ